MAARTRQPYAKVVPGTEKTDGSETGVYTSVFEVTETHKKLDHLKTLPEAFDHGAAISAKEPCMGWRPMVADANTGGITYKPYKWATYNEIVQRRQNFGCGIKKIQNEVLKLENKGWKLGIYSPNKVEWQIADLAAMAFSIVTVPLYDTLGPAAVEYVLNHAEIPVTLCSIGKIKTFIDLAPNCPKLKVIIYFDDIESKEIETYKKDCTKAGIQLIAFTEVENMGKMNIVPFEYPKEDDVAWISYTSGTTGTPKGAMLTHKNVIKLSFSLLDHKISISTNDCHISYLPLAHIYERMVLNFALIMGARVGFYRGDVASLMDDIKELQPTMFVSVPRLLNRIYERIITQSKASPIKAAVFSKALADKLANYKRGQFTHFLWDRLVFSRARTMLGGKVRLMLSSSAPLSPEVKKVVAVVFSCPIIETYGQTEVCGGLTFTLEKDTDDAHVGSIVTGHELKLVSVPDLKYTALDKPYPRGEVWFRGPCIFPGYLNDPVKTKEIVNEEGWLMTGDIGQIDEMGRLSIIDRKKNIFKLAQGEYIAPEKIENVYAKVPLIAQIFVHGDSLQNSLVAIVVLNPDVAIPLAKAHKIIGQNDIDPVEATLSGHTIAPEPNLDRITASVEMKKLVQAEMDKIAKEEKLRGFEVVKNIFLESEVFTMENGLISPTFKLKRNEAAVRFRPQIDELYRELNAKEASA
ncbi:Long chain acyl-CoA synthetase 7 peroxisomal [Chytridiales sp. JEL 0842]|nr:Long chain acyl-CoA synthetase 7 peroxisomal [Chytridiales sp. JEL 0842]